MAFKTFAPGVLTSSDVNTFLMRQAVITCTSSTRPASPSEGMTIYETDTDTVLTYSGSAWETGYQIGAWTSFTPTISGADAWNIGNGTWDARYVKIGRLVQAQYKFTVGSTTTAPTGVDYYFSLPVTRRVGSDRTTGSGYLYDLSVTAFYQLHSAITVNVLAVSLFNTNLTYTQPTRPQNGTPFTWDTGDEYAFQITYEAAS